MLIISQEWLCKIVDGGGQCRDYEPENQQRKCGAMGVINPRLEATIERCDFWDDAGLETETYKRLGDDQK